MEKTQGPRPTNYDLHEKIQAEKMTAVMAEERMLRSSMNGCAAPSDPLDDFFRYHPPTAEDLPKYAAINQAAKNFAEVLRANCPYSSDYRDAIRKLREARMIANAAVALRGRGF